ncbi:MAG TPA: hypothetical protein VMM13_11290 [Euzebya sp.]|nr:hypothetical protein [Euzebya sp.]
MSGAGEMAALLGLGAFHGLNPGMGWLFAVALGMQERRRRAVLEAIPPLAAGHAAAVVVALALFATVRAVASPRVVAVATGAVLVGFGLWHLLRRRHPRWVGMHLRPRELALWSFVMASAHGAGLMLLPVVNHRSAVEHPVTGLAAAAVVDAGGAVAIAAAIHTVGMLTMMTGVALLVYDHFGLAILRRSWFNVDLLWWVALITAGIFVFFT